MVGKESLPLERFLKRFFGGKTSSRRASRNSAEEVGRIFCRKGGRIGGRKMSSSITRIISSSSRPNSSRYSDFNLSRIAAERRARPQIRKSIYSAVSKRPMNPLTSSARSSSHGLIFCNSKMSVSTRHG
jgi:hypothetical protein